MSTKPPWSAQPAGGESEHEELRQLVNAVRERVITLWRQADALDAAGWDSRAIRLEVEAAHARYLDLYMVLLTLDASSADGPRHE